MKVSFSRKIVVVVALIAILSITSCGKSGYGCPYELKVPSAICLIK